MIAIGYSRLLYTHLSPLFRVRPVNSRPQDHHKANDLEVILYSEYSTTKNPLKMCHSTKKNASRVVVHLSPSFCPVSICPNGFPRGTRRAVVHTTCPSHAMARTCQWGSPSAVLAAAEAAEAEADEADYYDPDSDDRSGSEISSVCWY